jgi:arsenate reductase (thioredoxin)
MPPSYNVLFLCTGNSARSIMAEAILNAKGAPQFRAFSAGSHPTEEVRAEALRQLRVTKLPTAGLRSKNWSEFATPGSPKMDFVFTVCDSAAKEICPVWPGQPMTAHWGVPDPAQTAGTPEQIERAFGDGLPDARSQDQPFSLLAAFEPRHPRDPEGDRPHRHSIRRRNPLFAH